MKRQVLNLTLLTALLTPVAVGTEIISDEELEDVSGGQLQQTINGGNVNLHQDNDNGAVVLHNNVQRFARGAYIFNGAASVGNNGTNIFNGSAVGPIVLDQRNNQCGENKVLRKQQEIGNGGDINSNAVQDNENGSVLITDNVQQNANNLSLVNSAVSAVSRATNIANITLPTTSIDVTQESIQRSQNEVAYDDSDAPNPVWLRDMDRDAYQYIRNEGDIEDEAHQRNDQGSVHITNNAQENISSFDVTNIAMSAANLGTNILNANITSSATVTQMNDQISVNKLALGSVDPDYELRQDIDNFGDIKGGAEQDNNNLSIQLMDNAQANANAGILINGAGSAINAASNIANISTATGGVNLNQTNQSVACNWIQTDSPQYIYNGGSVSGRQINNDNSVYLSGAVMGSMTAVMAVNAASSAVNIAQNIASISSAGGPIVVTQTNTQTANNVVGAGTTNPGCGITCP